MTAMEMADYQQVPTDEAEAQMLASVDLDGMKSKRPTTVGLISICLPVWPSKNIQIVFFFCFIYQHLSMAVSYSLIIEFIC